MIVVNPACCGPNVYYCVGGQVLAQNPGPAPAGATGGPWANYADALAGCKAPDLAFPCCSTNLVYSSRRTVVFLNKTGIASQLPNTYDIVNTSTATFVWLPSNPLVNMPGFQGIPRMELVCASAGAGTYVNLVFPDRFPYIPSDPSGAQLFPNTYNSPWRDYTLYPPFNGGSLQVLPCSQAMTFPQYTGNWVLNHLSGTTIDATGTVDIWLF